MRALSVTDNFFRMLGVEAAAGRLFEPGDSGVDAAPLAVLTWGCWQSRFGGDPDVIGRTLSLSERPFTVIGILPSHFQFALRGSAEIWLPLQVGERRLEARSWHWLDAVARLRPGISPELAAAELQSTADRIAEVDPQWHTGHSLMLVPLRREIVGHVRPAIIALMAGVVMVLLIVCSNLANLLLLRSTGRRREIALRAALGASRWRLARQLMTESLLLASLGGLGGWVVAGLGTRMLLDGLPPRWKLHLPYVDGFALSTPAFLFTIGVALATGLVFGLAPTLRAMRPELSETLKETRGAVAPTRGRLGRAFVISEVALALVLLVAAGLTTRSFVALMQVSPGFDTENLLTGRISLPGTRYDDDEKLRAMHDRLLAEVTALPGVSGAATVSQLPLTGRGDTGGFKVFGRSEDERIEANIRVVSTSYFDVMGIPLRDGRPLDDRDRADAPPVVLVNRTLAERVFSGEALRQKISFTFFEGEPWWEIAGVVADERVDTLDRGVTPIVYFAYDQTPNRADSVVIRSTVEPASLIRQVRHAVTTIDAELPLYEVRMMATVISDSMPVFVRRYLAFLIGGFALLAAALAAIGIYGVTAYSVEQRRHEIGVRMALGAAPRQVVRMVLRQGFSLAGIGVLLGLAGAALATRTLATLLFGVTGTDAVVYVTVAAFLAAVVLLACSLPARRAVRVDPVVALRDE